MPDHDPRVRTAALPRAPPAVWPPWAGRPDRWRPSARCATGTPGPRQAPSLPSPPRQPVATSPRPRSHRLTEVSRSTPSPSKGLAGRLVACVPGHPLVHAHAPAVPPHTAMAFVASSRGVAVSQSPDTGRRPFNSMRPHACVPFPVEWLDGWRWIDGWMPEPMTTRNQYCINTVLLLAHTCYYVPTSRSVGRNDT